MKRNGKKIFKTDGWTECVYIHTIVIRFTSRRKKNDKIEFHQQQQTTTTTGI